MDGDAWLLVTGAGGKTGRTVVRAAAARGLRVRAGVRRAEAAPALRAAGAQDVVALDLLGDASVAAACAGVQRIYHICPNVHPLEEAIGARVIAAAEAAGVERLVYHSVLHPLTAPMPHHWRKLAVEQRLLASRLAWTVLQPTAYMENLAAQVPRARAEGIYAVPYGAAARISLVALEDVGEAAGRVLSEGGHEFATYPLAGTPPLAQTEVAEALGVALGRPVTSAAIPVAEWAASARAHLDDARIETLARMFAYYDRWGLPGNPNVLRWLLGRAPTSLDAVLRTLAAQP